MEDNFFSPAQRAEQKAAKDLAQGQKKPRAKRQNEDNKDEDNAEQDYFDPSTQQRKKGSKGRRNRPRDTE